MESRQWAVCCDMKAKYCSDRWESDVAKRVLDYFDKINRYK